MLTESQVEVIADDLFIQHEDKKHFVSLSEKNLTVGDAYRVQDALVARFAHKHQASVSGYKIALTSKKMQEWLKINEPCAGQVLGNRICHSPYTVRTADYGRLSVEMEVCVVLERDMAGTVSFEDVKQNIRSLHSAYELVDDRGADLSALDVESLVADNSWNEGIVIGPPAPPGLDLDDRIGRLIWNGSRRMEGTTRETIGGNPLHVVVWLAAHLGKLGRKIKAGEPIITGSVIPTQFPKPGDILEFEMAGFPGVKLELQ
jgi:2-keto-4-pentenoate hydratase